MVHGGASGGTKPPILTPSPHMVVLGLSRTGEAQSLWVSSKKVSPLEEAPTAACREDEILLQVPPGEKTLPCACPPSHPPAPPTWTFPRPFPPHVPCP